ncbi:class I SAM-dependent methyltransferase [Nocardia seriolae]|uniref:SAM-dependent methyltransferase n=1 Tax=Nocardia seriolae TaxID=37332 RepID=A0ABC9Z2J7_9NOCA|nr:class I SAM-dependent methyltransferase [Nocardia seriolae]OJF82750.1 SAM-dependent methyltransferase [Nocardia seriolae]PSK28073.1 methyltransferase domain-containing protein [Nocardia seriolae]QOW33510.1 methyltransferase [Nocardia seriolae]QUN20742.1 methyltransferase [Nocardia seriolae]RLP28611.1 methyltransferase domain-containing protein [Nocardia seriolae]
MVEVEDVLRRLRRYPDVEAVNLFAVDAADRLMLDVAADSLAAAGDGRVTVIDDGYGALTLGVIAAHGLRGVRVHQDLLTGELALANNARIVGLSDRFATHPLGLELLDGVRVVLWRLPRALSGLAETAEAIARYADPEVQVFAGGRDKYLTPAMNEVLAESFGSVRASRGRQKSRILLASEPKPIGEPRFPVRNRLDDRDLEVVAHGAAFSGPRLDIGTRFLLDYLERMKPDARDAIDLGCGTGILAVALAKARPGLRVTATDQSAAAVASTRATAAANGVADRVTVLQDDAMSGAPDNSADLVLCNPPFHVGAAVHTGSAIKMFQQTGRVLRPGGELWTVYNTHLNYRGVMERMVGKTDVMGRNRKFTVTRSVRGLHDAEQ